jgi:predicted nucleic acid-binding protein
MVTSLYREDPLVVAWWGTEVECVSALARLERATQIDADTMNTCVGRLRDLRKSWSEIEPSSAVKDLALRLLRVHDLRAADSLQLAAALVASESHQANLDFVCLDHRLSIAARREGFTVLDLS